MLDGVAARSLPRIALIFDVEYKGVPPLCFLSKAVFP
jgi:hypothetical protein